MEYVSKHNKKALKKLISLERKKEKLYRKINESNDEIKSLHSSLPYPIFLAKYSYEQEYYAHLSPKKSIKITKSNSPNKYSCNYIISIMDLDSSKPENLDVKDLKNRITKKKFMQIYKEAKNTMDEVMVFSKRAKKEILCERLIEDQ